MAKIEIELSQGWTKGLTVCFDDIQASHKKDVSNEFFCTQVHGSELHVVSESDLRQKSPLKEADGLVCEGNLLKTLGKSLCVFTADCVPLVYVDHENQWVAVIHAGWRGLARGIHMLPFRDCRFDPASTWVWVGPHIHQDSYEVKADLLDSFPRWAKEAAIFQQVKSEQSVPTWNFSMMELIRREFHSLSVELVYDVGVNTFDDKSFASYRRAQKLGVDLKGVRNVTSIRWAG